MKSASGFVGALVGGLVGAGMLAAAASAQVGEPAGDAATPAAEPAPAQAPAPATDPETISGTEADDRFKLSLAPYVWLPSFAGDVTARGIRFDATTSFADILDGTDSIFGLMGAIDLEVDRLVFQLNGAWTTAEVSNTRGVLQNGEVRSDIEFDAAWTEAFAGYRFLDRAAGRDGQQRFTLDGFVGGRITLIDVDSAVTAESTITLPDGSVLNPGQTRRQSQSKEWAEPFVGVRTGHDFGNGWSTMLRADVGGFGVDGSDFSWQTVALVGYRWRLDGWDVGLFGGYRALGQDYSSGDFGWDIVTHGPIVGGQFVFRF